jgi:hypothetical protein
MTIVWGQLEEMLPGISRKNTYIQNGVIPTGAKRRDLFS